MDDAAVYQRMLPSMRAFWRGVVANSSSSSLIERDGLLAAVVPEAPSRSFFNSVLYTDPEALGAGLNELADSYEKAGVGAWTVWVPRADEATARLLEVAGHVHDAEPRMMLAEDLAAIEPGDFGGAEWTREPDPMQFALVLDRAFGMEGEGFAEAIDDRFDVADGYTYLATVDGEPATTAMVIDADDDAGVFAIGTTPAAQGRGLATALLRQALCDARERGCRTSTLQATKAGQPIYERMGFETFEPIDMWERRKPSE